MCSIGLDYGGAMDDWHVMLEPDQEMPVLDIKIEEKMIFLKLLMNVRN